MLLILLSVLPIVILLIFTYLNDKFEREPIALLFRSFGCGTLAPTIVLVLFLPLADYEFSKTAWGAFADAFLTAGIPEELVKFTMLYCLIWKNSNFNEYFDGIVYAVFISLGFACVENILYVMEGGVRIAIFRAFLAVPAHFLFAVIMGFYFSLAKFKRKNSYLILSLLFAIIAHGMYDFFLFYTNSLKDINGVGASLIMLCFFIFDILLWRIGIKYIRKHQKNSEPVAPLAEEN